MENDASPVYPVSVGDVFTIPVDDRRRVIGQVVGEYRSAFYVLVFDRIVEDAGSASDHIHELADDEPVFARMVFDARFRPGMWEIVGHSADDLASRLPAFAYGSGDLDGVKITDFHGTTVRPASSDEASRIPRLAIDSPLILEKAVQAHFGAGPRNPAFEELQYRRTPTSRQLFGR